MHFSDLNTVCNNDKLTKLWIILFDGLRFDLILLKLRCLTHKVFSSSF